MSQTSDPNVSSSSAIKLTGGCACGKIKYTSTALPTNTQNCYCITCRKISGAPFITFGAIKSSDISWTNKPTSLYSSVIADRAYCADCKTQLYMFYPMDPLVTWITIGSIDEDSVDSELIRPKGHIFVEQKVKWFEITDGERQSKRHHGGFEDEIDEWLQEKGLSF
jgi:hypothetical protein